MTFNFIVDNFFCLLLGHSSGADLSQPFPHSGVCPISAAPWAEFQGGGNIAGISSKSQVFLPVILRYYTNEVAVDAKIDKAFKKVSIEKTILLLAK